jgi:molybdate transport system permease protein
LDSSASQSEASADVFIERLFETQVFASFSLAQVVYTARTGSSVAEDWFRSMFHGLIVSFGGRRSWTSLSEPSAINRCFSTRVSPFNSTRCMEFDADRPSRIQRDTALKSWLFMTIDWFPLTLSLRVAALSTAASLVIGLALAYWLANGSFRGREIADAAITLPLVLPPTVLGYYLLVVIGRETIVGRAYEALIGSPLVFTWQAAVLAAFFHSAPLLIKSARAALESVDHTYERAARSLGASETRLFFRITLPLAWRSILAATVLCFARAMGDFGATLMVAGNIPGQTQTVSIAIYDAVESGNGQLARVLVIIVSVLVLAILSAANWLGDAWAPSRQAGR